MTEHRVTATPDNGDVELAAGGRGPDYPPEWGRPEGRQLSEDRARWVARNVRKMQADPQVRLRRLARSEKARQLSAFEVAERNASTTGRPVLAAALAILRDLP